MRDGRQTLGRLGLLILLALAAQSSGSAWAGDNKEEKAMQAIAHVIAGGPYNAA